MFIILGGTGHVGSAVAAALIERGADLTIVGRDVGHMPDAVAGRARFAECDLLDRDRLHAILRGGRRAFLLNPPGDPTGDSNSAEQATIAAILAAMDGAGLELAVAQSTYGARPGPPCGDLTTLHALEQGLANQTIPAQVIRAAYHYSNWDFALAEARTGRLTSLMPADLALPMVSPLDIGRAAAEALTGPAVAGLTHAEGPHRLTPRDVAAAFGRALGHDVAVAEIPRRDWQDWFRQAGFSQGAAKSYGCMTAATVDTADSWPRDPLRGSVTIDEHIAALLQQD